MARSHAIHVFSTSSQSLLSRATFRGKLLAKVVKQLVHIIEAGRISSNKLLNHIMQLSQLVLAPQLASSLPLGLGFGFGFRLRFTLGLGSSHRTTLDSP